MTDITLDLNEPVAHEAELCYKRASKFLGVRSCLRYVR